MLRKTLVILLLIISLFSLVSCDKNEPANQEVNNSVVSKTNNFTNINSNTISNVTSKENTSKPVSHKEETFESLEYKGNTWKDSTIAKEEYDYDEIDDAFYGNVKYNPATKTITVSGKGRVCNLYMWNNISDWNKQKRLAKKIVFEEGITEISECFCNMSALESIEFPKSLKNIYSSFEDACALKEIIIPATIKEISGQAFENSALSKITFNGAIHIGNNAFNYLNNLETILIPEGSVCEESFRYCINLKEVILEKNVDLKEGWEFMNDDDDPLVENPIIYRYNFMKKENSYPKAYLYLPNDGENHPWGEDGKYKPIIVPEGEDWKNYRNLAMTLKEE